MFQPACPPRCDISLNTGYNQKLISCESKYDDEVFHSGNNDKERDERHHSGISSQSSTPGLYQKYNQPCRNSYRTSSSNHSEIESRGTKRHFQNNQTSRSPSPLLSLSSFSSLSSLSCNSFKPVTNEPIASRPKRRLQEIGHGLPPIIASACLININFRSFRPDNLLDGGQWDRLSHAIWCKYTTHEQTSDTLRRKLRLREMVHQFIKVVEITRAFVTHFLMILLLYRVICTSADCTLLGRVCQDSAERAVIWTCVW